MLRPVFVFSLLAIAIAPATGRAAGGISVPAHPPLLTPAKALPGGVPVIADAPTPPPLSALFSVTPQKVVAGDAPRIRLQINEGRAHKVSVRVTFQALGGNGHTLEVDLGRQPTGRPVTATWPAHTTLQAGRYVVILHATGPHHLQLVRQAHASGRTTLTVAPAPKPVVVKPKPKPVTTTPGTTPTTPTTPTTTATTPTTPVVIPPAGTAGTFPVQGPHTYGDPFGAQRKGYSHQGQDVLAALGTPIVAPLPGTIVTTGYQASSAGYYVVENAADGHAYFFAHCAHASTAVTPGQTVSQGQGICHVGQTGDATGPHLHFEEWVGGWRVNSASHPIDPLAQLKLWDR